MLGQTLKGQAMTRTDPFGSADIIRGSAPIFSGPDSDNVVGAVVVDYFLPKSIAKPAANISRTAEDYFQLVKFFKQPILNSYILALVLIGLVVVLLASWFGMYLARAASRVRLASWPPARMRSRVAISNTPSTRSVTTRLGNW